MGIQYKKTGYIVCPLLIYFLLNILILSSVYAGDTWQTSNERWFERGSAVIDSYADCSYTYRYGVNPDFSIPTLAIYVASSSGGACDTASVAAYYCKDDGTKTWEVNLLGISQKMVPGALDGLTSAPGRVCQVACPDNAKRDDITGECPLECGENEEIIDNECQPMCEQEYQIAEQTCGLENINWISWETCEWSCTDCGDLRQQLITDCPHGYIEDQASCAGRCKDCSDHYMDCQEECSTRGGIQVEGCTYDETSGFDATCLCNDGYLAPVLQPSDTPTIPDDKIPQPDPTDPDPSKTDPYSEAIKKNLDTVIAQNNDRKDQLSNIAGNISKGVDNQAKQTQGINDQIGKGNELLEGINKTSKEVLDELKKDKGIEPDSSLSGAPGQPEYNTDLDPEGTYNLNEYSDPLEAAINRSSEEVIWLNNQIDNQQTPVQASITATGDACLNGTVTLHGHQKALSICFDKPWMLQGYALMKIVLVGCGYIQVIMMLNRALLGA
jgi:hypothetical protein